MHLESPYYIVYEVILYWKNEENEIKSFYKIGLKKVWDTEKVLNYRFKREINKGVKVFVINEMKFDYYDDCEVMEERALRLAFKKNIEDFKPEKSKYKRKTPYLGDFKEYPNSFAGSTEVFKTPKKFENLVSKLGLYFDKNPSVYYPKKFNKELENELRMRKKET